MSESTGLISQAAARVTAPQQGSTQQDIARAGAGFIAGMLEEERRQEEQRLREAALALEERRTQVAEEGLVVQREGLADRRQQHLERMDLENARFDFMQDIEERDEATRIRQEQARLRGVRHALVNTFGRDPNVVSQYDAETAAMEYQHLSQLARTRQEGADMALVSGIQGTMDLLGEVNSSLAQARPVYQTALQNFNDWLQNNLELAAPTPGEREIILQASTDALVRDPRLRQIYEASNPEAFGILQRSEQQLNSLLEQQSLQYERLDGFQQRLMQNQGMTESGQMPRPTGQAQHWGELSPDDQVITSRDILLDARQAPEILLESWDALEEKGVPLGQILAQENLTRADIEREVTAAREAAAVSGPQPVQGPYGPGASLIPPPPPPTPEEQRAARLEQLTEVLAPTTTASRVNDVVAGYTSEEAHQERIQGRKERRGFDPDRPIHEQIREQRQATGSGAFGAAQTPNQRAAKAEAQEQLPNALAASREMMELGVDRAQILEMIRNEHLRELVDQRLPKRLPVRVTLPPVLDAELIRGRDRLRRGPSGDLEL